MPQDAARLAAVRAVTERLPVANPAPCRHCGAPCWAADVEGPVHPCCLWWADELAKGRPCPSCIEARRRASEWSRRRR